jgi:hypothetical protein
MTLLDHIAHFGVRGGGIILKMLHQGVWVDPEQFWPCLRKFWILFIIPFPIR